MIHVYGYVMERREVNLHIKIVERKTSLLFPNICKPRTIFAYLGYKPIKYE